MKALAPLFIIGPFLFVTAVVVGVILILYVTDKLDVELWFNPKGEITEDTVLFRHTKPMVREKQISDYLDKNAGLQLKEKGGSFFRFGAIHDIDPAFAVAVAKVETDLGKKKCDVRISSADWQRCNNFFCLKYFRFVFTGSGSGNCSSSKWASFETIDDGIDAFYKFIDKKFIQVRPPQNSVSKIGCTTGDFDFCYCEMTDSDCERWVTEVKRIIREIKGSES